MATYFWVDDNIVIRFVENEIIWNSRYVTEMNRFTGCIYLQLIRRESLLQWYELCDQIYAINVGVRDLQYSTALLRQRRRGGIVYISQPQLVNFNDLSYLASRIIKFILRSILSSISKELFFKTNQTYFNCKNYLS